MDRMAAEQLALCCGASPHRCAMCAVPPHAALRLLAATRSLRRPRRRCAHHRASNHPLLHRSLTPQLLERIAPLKRGLLATDEDRAEVEALAAELERLNPTKRPLAAPELLSAKWELLYTTSASILGTSKPALLRPSGPIFQFIDAEGLRAKNQETAPFYNSVTAALEPLSDSKVKVVFKTFKLLNLIPITAPPSAVGELDVTFLDEELRVSRGDKGNLFVLAAAERGAGAAF